MYIYIYQMEKKRGIEEEILSAFPHPVIVVGTDGLVVYANPSAYDFFMPQGRLEGIDIERIIDNSDILLVVQKVRTTGEGIFNVEGKLSSGRGERRVIADLFPLEYTSGSGVVIILRDITRFSILEERSGKERLSLESEQLLRRVFSYIAPLVAGILELCRFAESKEKEVEELPLIKEEALRLNHVVSEVLEFAAEASVVRRPVNIYKLVDDAIAMCRRDIDSKDINLEKDYVPGMPDVKAEPVELFKAIFQLVKNAVEASPKGGTIRIRLYVDTERKLVPNHPTLRLELWDEGDEVPADIANSIFSPFVTTKPGHLGLGLAKAYKIVREHDGDISYSRVKGHNVFTVYLPML